MTRTNPLDRLTGNDGSPADPEAPARIGISCVAAVISGALLARAWQMMPDSHGLLVLLSVPIAVGIAFLLRMGPNAHRGVNPLYAVPACVVFSLFFVLVLSQLRAASDLPALGAIILTCVLAIVATFIALGGAPQAAPPSPVKYEPAPQPPPPIPEPEPPVVPTPPMRDRLPAWPPDWYDVPVGTAACCLPVRATAAPLLAGMHDPTIIGDDNNVKRCPTCSRPFCRQCVYNSKEKCPFCNFPGSVWPNRA